MQWLPSAQSIRTKLLNDPYYRLQSRAEIAIAADLGIQIDVNKAKVDDWLRLPGLSIHQARNLVQLCQAGVQFCCIEDIAAALSISVQHLQPLVPVLKFCYYDEILTIAPLSPNIATIEQLTEIPAIDLRLAQSIVHNRDLQGAYRNLVDFQRRLSLPGALISQLMYYLQF
ncbi:ComEA family DNA-binding protein [Synechocystis sp. PCC 7509]|uniref:ComEA family DNA-binding protein n=1 Tax=Synechocystis sp. PCC 7509 TaxID=927677 RepID=UPI0002ACB347|nr:ComEA family DNA-binding protein [Synechocystis sp. PCC 7509]